MRKKVTYFIIIGLLYSCSILKKSSAPNSNDNLIGVWTEHWGNDFLETDVNYVDTLKIDIIDNGKIKIICVNNTNYVYRKIKYNDSKLFFQMENKVDPKKKFIIDYSLIKTDDKQFDGETINSRGKKVKIKLKKQL